MKKVKKVSCFILLAIFSITCMFAGCGKKADTAVAEKKTVTIKDFKGNSVNVPFEPKRIVVMNNAMAEVICILGESDKIVGVSESAKFPEELTKKQKVGKAFTPDVEKILELKPDIVLGCKGYAKEETIEKMKAAGINYVGLDGYKIQALPENIRDMGAMLNKKEKAEEYVSFMNKYLDLVKERTAKLKPEERATVFWEWPTDYQTVSKNSSGDQIINAAGAINIAANEQVEFPKVSSEWILEKNPKVVMKGAKYNIPVGYGLKDNKNLVTQRESVLKRTGWDKMDAVKKGNVYVVASEVGDSTRSVVGVCYLAKWCYPDLFKDLDPEAVHKELLQKFYKVDYKGYWVCP